MMGILLEMHFSPCTLRGGKLSLPRSLLLVEFWLWAKCPWKHIRIIVTIVEEVQCIFCIDSDWKVYWKFMIMSYMSTTQLTWCVLTNMIFQTQTARNGESNENALPKRHKTHKIEKSHPFSSHFYLSFLDTSQINTNFSYFDLVLHLARHFCE